MHRVVLISAVVFLINGSGFGAEANADVLEKLRPVPPFASAVAWAQGAKISLNQVDSTTDGDKLNPGDSITGVILLHEKGVRPKQWLVYSEIVNSSPNDDFSKKPDRMVLYTTLGNKLEFKSSPVMVKVRTIGPFVDTGEKKKPKIEEESARFPLDKGYLSLGLDRAVAAALKFKENKEHGDFSFSSKPFNEPEINKGRKLAAATHITTEDERALCGSCPALLSYFDLAANTPGLKDICFKVVELPSVWSMIRHVGVTPNLTFQTEKFRGADAFAWESPLKAPVYYFPMSLQLNGQPALRLTFVVTSPKPPLLGCGGVVGMLAEKPGDKETYLTFRVIGARHPGSAPN